MNPSTTETELNSLLNRLTADNMASENQIKVLQKQIKDIEKQVKENDDLIRPIRARLGVTNSPAKETIYGSKAEKIREAIKRIEKPQFTQFDVISEIKRAYPEMDVATRWVATQLWVLSDKRKLIKRVLRGSNQNAAVFEKITNATNGALLTPPPRKTPQVPMRREEAVK